MKNYNIIGFLFATFFVASIFSCSKNVSNSEVQQTSGMQVSDFVYLGDWHNNFLFNAKDKLINIDERAPSQEEAMSILLNINIDYARNTMPEDMDFNSLEHCFRESCQFSNEVFLAERTFLPVNLRSNPVDNQGLSLYEMIQELREEGVLSEFSEAVLLELTNSLKSNYEKTISDADMKQVVVNLIERFDSHGFSKDSYEGEMLGTILAISIASLECWENNPELMPSDTKIAHWVAMDISGAAIGAVSGAVGGLITQGEVSAKGVAYGAVAGAVIGSTGIVGKGAKWIQGILK